MSKILVTGGAGFIGFHLSQTLLNRGDKVIIVDNMNDYYDPQLKEDRLKKLLSIQTDLKVNKIDIVNYQELEKVFQENKIDKVCHLAAQAGVRYSLTNPFTYEQCNILGTLNMLELCRHYNVKDFIYASSSSIYGNNKKMPFSEKDRVDQPISLYAASKKSNEEMAYTYHHLFGLNTTGLRFFTVYGPWGRPDMALSLFADAMSKGESIDVYNFGKMKRDFTYIDDIVQGVLMSLDKAYPNEIFNLGRGECVELLDYIGELEKNMGVVAKKHMMEIQPGDVPATSADISQAQKMLDYQPQTSVPAGISNFVDWYKEYYKI